MKRFALLLKIMILFLVITGTTKISEAANVSYVWTDSGSCGEGCEYTYDSTSKTVTITASGENATLDKGRFYYYNVKNMPQINNIIIRGAIAVGEDALHGNNKLISGSNGVLIFNAIGWHSLGNVIVASDIIIPKDASLDEFALLNSNIRGKIYCAIDNCAQKMIDSCHVKKYEGYWSSCLNTVNSIISNPAKFEQAPKGCNLYYLTSCLKPEKCQDNYSLDENNNCILCNKKGYKNIDGYCNRIQYTPAEAAPLLHNDNTNSVTITFKK